MDFSLPAHPLMDTFHVLAMVNSTAVSTLECRHVLKHWFRLLSIHARMWDCWLSVVALRLIPSAAHMLFPAVASLASFTSVVCESSLFSRFSPTLVIFRHLDADHPGKSEVVPHCGFSQHFLGDQ